MAWLRRAVSVEVPAPPAELARTLMAALGRDSRPRLHGQAGPFGFALHSEWRPALLRQHYPVEASGTFSPSAGGTRVDATISVGFAVQFMLAGAAGVAGVALWGGLVGRWPAATAALVTVVAAGHVYSVLANLRDAERTLRLALGVRPVGPNAEAS